MFNYYRKRNYCHEDYFVKYVDTVCLNVTLLRLCSRTAQYKNRISKITKLNPYAGAYDLERRQIVMKIILIKYEYYN